jgi:hypothetical protein
MGALPGEDGADDALDGADEIVKGAIVAAILDLGAGMADRAAVPPETLGDIAHRQLKRDMAHIHGDLLDKRQGETLVAFGDGPWANE